MRNSIFAVFLLGASSGLAAEVPSTILNDQLPPWVRVSFEHRFRMEGYTALRYQQGNDDRWFLNRLRANLTLLPVKGWSLNFQAQDSRIFFKSNPNNQNPYTNRTDLRLAYTDLGTVDKSAIALRVGRQELAYGDERILGAANWGNVARAFDAAKLILRKGRWQWDLASASVVLPQVRGISHHLQGNNLHFAYGKWTNPLPQTTIEPYVMWRVGGGSGDALAGILKQSRWVSGVRVAGKLPADLEYITEWITQSGYLINSKGRESIRAFAQHTVLRKALRGVAWSPRLLAEYNFASGDARPGDGHNGTFDQMFPTPHEKYGLADQVGWQNVQHVSGGVEAKPRKALLLRAMVQDWHLAQAKDALYAAGGALVFRDATGQAGRHVGEEVDLIAQYNWGARYVGGGFGHLFAGKFLHAVSPGAGLNYVYLNVGYRF